MSGRRVVQLALVVADQVLIYAVVTLADGPTIHPMAPFQLQTVLISLWWAGPSLIHLAHESWAGTTISGVALLVTSAVALGSMYISEGSTVAIGFLTIPVLRALLGGAIVVGAWAVSRIRFP